MPDRSDGRQDEGRPTPADSGNNLFWPFPRRDMGASEAANSPSVESSVRWMIQIDRPQAIALDAKISHDPWSEEDFANHLRQRRGIGIVASTKPGEVLGFACYDLLPDSIHVKKLTCVDLNVAKKLLLNLVVKADQHKTPRYIHLSVPEEALETQILLRDLGFKCKKIDKFGPENILYFFEYRPGSYAAAPEQQNT